MDMSVARDKFSSRRDKISSRRDKFLSRATVTAACLLVLVGGRRGGGIDALEGHVMQGQLAHHLAAGREAGAHALDAGGVDVVGLVVRIDVERRAERAEVAQTHAVALTQVLDDLILEGVEARLDVRRGERRHLLDSADNLRAVDGLRRRDVGIVLDGAVGHVLAAGCIEVNHDTVIF